MLRKKGGVIFFLQTNLHLLDKPCQRLGPGHHVDVLLHVHDLYLLPQLRDDGTCPPAMFQGQILQNKEQNQPSI